MNKNIDKTSKQGDKTELLIAEFLSEALQVAITLNKDGRYDLKIHNTTLEVKDESNYIDSGNVCIETDRLYNWQDKWEDCGITTSQADYYIHYFSPKKLVVYKTEKMRKWLRDNHKENTTVDKRNIVSKKNEDGNKTTAGYILPIDFLLQNASQTEIEVITLSDLFYKLM